MCTAILWGFYGEGIFTNLWHLLFSYGIFLGPAYKKHNTVNDFQTADNSTWLATFVREPKVLLHSYTGVGTNEITFGDELP